jgi:hypothetical protein
VQVRDEDGAKALSGFFIITAGLACGASAFKRIKQRAHSNYSNVSWAGLSVFLAWPRQSEGQQNQRVPTQS